MMDGFVQFFDRESWTYEVNEDERFVRLGFEGENGNLVCIAIPREEEEQMLFYVYVPVSAPPERRAAVAELLHRANWGMLIGNFEIDFRDGEIRYKASVDAEGTEVTPALVQPLCYASLSTADRHIPAIQAVAEGRADAETALSLLDAG